MEILPAIINQKSIVRYEARDIPSYLSKDEVDRMLSVCTNKRDHLLINTAWNVGVRVSELIRLKVSDIDFYNLLIKFVTLKKKGRKTKEFHRIIPVKPELTTELSAYILENEIKDRIFPLTRQRAFQIVQQKASEAGITRKIHPHSLRHGYAVNLISQGVPISVVKDLLGHSSVLTTMVYLKIIKPDVQKFLNEVKF